MQENFLFYFFGGLAVLSAGMVISIKNPVHSVLFLILTFIASAALLFLLEIEFISLIFIVVYVGAIAVLFLFVVMMLDIKITDSNRFFFKYFPIGSFLGFAFLVEVLLILTENLESSPYSLTWLENRTYTFEWMLSLDFITNVGVVGQVLYTYYFMYFLIAGIILLVAMVGAIVLTLVFNKSSKIQLLPRQIARSSANSTLVVRSLSKE
jgi:NADH-quinone oxidoreductase subunit J